MPEWMKKYRPGLAAIFSFFLQLNIGFPQTYNLSSPDLKLVLPDILREISDISVVNPTTIACVQDEKGILFKYNVKKNCIATQDSFYVDGDYEGLAVVNKDVYILRADGILIELLNGLKTVENMKTYATGVPAINSEGLCYDKNKNRLLIACKSRSNNIDKDKRMIYAFDLEKKVLSPEPVFEINIPAIKTYLGQKYGLVDSVANAIKFKPSAIAIHPLNGKLYMLSASGKVLCIFNNGNLEYAERLDPLLFNKAEGISFKKNGDMFISNEGQLGKATLLMFKCKKS